MGKIFINYRHDDAMDSVGFLDYILVHEFSRDFIFKDMQSMKPGDDFEKVISDQIANCDVLLAVIGPKWQESISVRQNEPDDFVRLEIKAALTLRKRVIPILVQDAAMPVAADLPSSIRLLASRHAIRLRSAHFVSDAHKLISGLHEALDEVKTERQSVRAEQERFNREAEETSRIVAAEERTKSLALKGLPREEILRAAELANWEFVKDQCETYWLRDHLARFPNGSTAQYAQSRLEQLMRNRLKALPSIKELEALSVKFLKGQDARSSSMQVANEVSSLVVHENIGNSIQTSTGRPQLNLISVIAVFMLLAGGVYWGYQHWLWQASLSDPSLKTIDFSQTPYKPGQSFKECKTCPEMIVVPEGAFSMGSPEVEDGRDKDELEVRVTIPKPFAVSKHEVNFEQWDACVKAGACNGYVPDDAGWGRGKRPAIYISWYDATSYVEWLSAKTGKSYLLPTEAQWEYFARAGTKTPYWQGHFITSKQANYSGYYVRNGRQYKGRYRGRTLPISSFKANSWGLYNVHGNVWEWTKDCLKQSNAGSSSNNNARDVINCDYRVVRGGSWFESAKELRSANRNWGKPSFRSNRIGFRVVRLIS